MGGALSRLSVGQRLLVLVIVAVTGLAAVKTYNLVQQYDEMLSARKRETRSIVGTAKSIVASYHRKAKNGEMATWAAKQGALNALEAIRFGEHGYVWVHNLETEMVMHPMKPELNGQDLTGVEDPNGKNLFVVMNERVAAEGSGHVRYMWPKPGSDAPVPKTSYVSAFEPWGWVIGNGLYYDDVRTAFWRHAGVGIAISTLVAAVVAMVSFAIVASITRPVRALQQTIDRIDADDLEVTVPATDSRDEIGRIARSVATFRDNARNRREETAARERQQKAERDAAARLQTASDDFDETVTGQLQTVESHASTVMQAIDDARQRIGQANRFASDIEEKADNAANNANAVASATGGLDEASRDIAQRASETKRTVDTVEGDVRTADARVQELVTQAHAISEIVETIREIADQTNLLALNATIEASRAGEAGKGFAVVAQEVKSLAGQTSEATQTIEKRIADIQDRTNQAASAMQQVADRIGEVETATGSIASAVEQQQASTGEITQNVDQATGAIKEVAGNIAKLNENVDATEKQADAVDTSARELRQTLDTLKGEIQDFLKTVRGSDGAG